MRSIKDYSISELVELQDFLENLPNEVNVQVTIDGEDINLEDYIETATEEFFNVTREDYEKIVGKCFIGSGIIIKVLDLPEDREDYEFLYEAFYNQSPSKYHDSWQSNDYIWLQNTGDPNYSKYLLTEYTEMNIAQEGMFQLGKDGNLYTDDDCSGSFGSIYKPVDEELFTFIRNNIKK